jgi:hypothetical protein
LTSQGTEFERELEIFRREEEEAQQHFFCWLAVRDLAASAHRYRCPSLILLISQFGATRDFAAVLKTSRKAAKHMRIRGLLDVDVFNGRYVSTPRRLKPFAGKSDEATA